jgi:2-methylcitrate dehydratase PrpD
MNRTNARWTRRRVIGSGAGLVAAAAVPLRPQSGAARRDDPPAATDLTGRVARYMAAARQQALSADVVREAKHRILDTLAAMISGARLKPGEMAIRFVRAQGGTPEASIATTDLRTSAINAALVNAMFAHADETDDFEPVTKAHPGCSAVPAALAVGERENGSGQELIRAVVLGYDLGCRWLQALGPNHVRATHRSAEGVSATMGAVAAAASMARLDEKGMRYALSYAVQQVSGVWSWERDLEHVEKAFDFAGMGARNGVTAALMAQAGFSGVPDVLEGEHNGLEAHSAQPRPERWPRISGGGFTSTKRPSRRFPSATRSSRRSTRCSRFVVSTISRPRSSIAWWCVCPRMARASSTIVRCQTSTCSI